MTTISSRLFRVALWVAIALAPVASQFAETTAAKNSWRGIVPLRSTISDVARTVGLSSDATESMSEGPFKVEGGEVAFSYLTPSLAKIYRAPKTMIGKVFTVYFRPDPPGSRGDLKLERSFRKCTEETDRRFYYLVNDAGIAYQLRTSDDAIETIIFQPSRAEVRNLAVNVTCVF